MFYVIHIYIYIYFWSRLFSNRINYYSFNGKFAIILLTVSLRYTEMFYYVIVIQYSSAIRRYLISNLQKTYAQKVKLYNINMIFNFTFISSI